MLNKLQSLKKTLEDQVRYGASESAQMRMLETVEAMILDAQPKEVYDTLMEEFVPVGQELKRVDGEEAEARMRDAWLPAEKKKGNFTPGTQQFALYVWQKANCKRDIEKIADRYDISEADVMEAYNIGRFIDRGN